VAQRISRRELLASAFWSFVGLTAGPRSFAVHASLNGSAFEEKISKLEKESGGHLGVAVLDTANQTRAQYRADERFPMCSTFKLLAVAAVLQRADQGKERLDRLVRYAASDLVTYSPVTEKHVETGMSIEGLCAAAVTLSDNTAGNLLLGAIGGPAGLTEFAGALGDTMTRLDRIEPELNEALPGDPRDTTTPASMLSNLRELVLGDALSASSRSLLKTWLVQNKTGDLLLRAGLPAGWTVGDKTGSGKRGTINDLAIVWPAHQGPLLISAYLNGASENYERRAAIIAEVGKVVAT